MSDEYQSSDHRYQEDHRQIQGRCHGGTCTLHHPEAQVTVHKCFYLPETADQFDFTQYDYVVDAVDTVTAKLEIIMRAKEAGVPVISCMGAGNN